MENFHVLYIDDEIDLLEIAAGFFQEEGIYIDTCSDIHQALELVSKKNYEVIISDAKMPHGSGYELFKILKMDRGFKGKLILVTGDLKDQDILGERFDVVMFKPLVFQELIQKVKSLMKPDNDEFG